MLVTLAGTVTDVLVTMIPSLLPICFLGMFRIKYQLALPAASGQWIGVSKLLPRFWKKAAEEMRQIRVGNVVAAGTSR